MLYESEPESEGIMQSTDTDRKTTLMVGNSINAVAELLERFPARSGKDRKKHILVKDSCIPHQRIAADERTVPGVLSERGCAFAGTKGVVIGPVKDILGIILGITHGPIGCAYYTWLMRRNLAEAEDGGDNFIQYTLSIRSPQICRKQTPYSGLRRSLQRQYGRLTRYSSQDVSQYTQPVR